MAGARTIARLEALIWVLIYGGLFSVVLGLALDRQGAAGMLALGVGGGIAVVVGAALIVVRARLARPPQTRADLPPRG